LRRPGTALCLRHENTLLVDAQFVDTYWYKWVDRKGRKVINIPRTNPSWSSPDSSSKDLPLVSTSKKEAKNPVSMKKANI